MSKILRMTVIESLIICLKKNAKKIKKSLILNCKSKKKKLMISNKICKKKKIKLQV